MPSCFTERTIDTIKEAATKAAQNLDDDVSPQELFDWECEAHNDLARREGASPAHQTVRLREVHGRRGGGGSSPLPPLVRG